MRKGTRLRNELEVTYLLLSLYRYFAIAFCKMAAVKDVEQLNKLLLDHVQKQEHAKVVETTKLRKISWRNNNLYPFSSSMTSSRSSLIAIYSRVCFSFFILYFHIK